MATANAATSYLERRILHYIFKNNSLTFNSPGNNIYVGLATNVTNFDNATGESGTPVITEATFTNYQRVQVTPTAVGSVGGWTMVGSDSTNTQTATNENNIEFSASGGTNNTITHVIIADQQSGGNVLFIGALDVQKVIETGDIFRINAGNLTIELK